MGGTDLGRLTPAQWIALLVAVPPAALAATWLGVHVATLAGRHPVWSTEPQNASEAAAARDGAAIVRLASAGHDLAAAHHVRAGFISDQPVTVTPIDAAVAQRRAEIVQLLFDLGATVNATDWERAWCSTNDVELRAVLQHRRPEAVTPVCAQPDVGEPR
jgi:hypothetical protein